MADYNDIKQAIATNLPDNNNREITAAKLRSTLNEFVDKVETTETGIEENVSDINTKITGLGKEGIYDVTANNDGATFASLSALLSDENLSILIPVEVRGGGMSIRFVRSSDNKYVQYRLTNQNWSIDVNDWTGGESEPTSVESEFATGEKVSEIGIDNKPTAGSNNLVKSGGVYDEYKSALKFKGVITDYTTSFQTLDSGFYRLFSNTANTFADLPDKEKTGSPGSRSWELIVFKIDYCAIYLLKRIYRNEGFPEYYLGYRYSDMSSIEWQIVRTDFSLKNHNEEMIFAGDSIMVRLMGEKGYLESLTNYTIVNKAISGSCMALRTDSLAENWNPKSMVYRTNPNNSSSEDFIDASNAKKIFIWMGANDRTAGNPLGADDSTSEHEIMGAMRKIVENILTQNPYISICFATPNANPNQSSTSPTLEDYANRIISGCEILNVECLDIFHQSCITETNKDTVFVDGLHPKQDWLHNVAANKFKERM